MRLPRENKRDFWDGVPYPIFPHKMLSTTSIPAPKRLLDSPLFVPEGRLLMGPGPSNVSKRVLEATAKPVLGHLHPEFCTIMDDIKSGLKYAFQTENPLTLALSATGHAGMECVMSNFIERGDVVLVANNGIWGQRAENMAKRQGAVVHTLEGEAGIPFTLSEIGSALGSTKPKLFFITHGESSTGTLQGLEGIGALCHSHDCLFAVDTVASLCGVPFSADALEVDVVYTGSQKVLGVPPGLAPISVSPRGVVALQARSSQPSSFYLDLLQLASYWQCLDPSAARPYHHTGPVNALYGLREGLAMLAEEGLEGCWRRHRMCADKLHEGLSTMGLELFVPCASARLPTVTTIKVPEGVDWKAVNGFAMKHHNVEIAGGLGPTAGRVWRIGVMGANASMDKVERALEALKGGIKEQKQK